MAIAAHGVRWLQAFAVCACISLSSGRSEKAHLDYAQREAAKEMLDAVRDTVKARYYDPRLHGVNLDARDEAAKDRLASVGTLSEAFGLAAWMLEPLDESGTIFIPPARPYKTESGWRINLYGDRCYLTAVEPGSDAAAQGLKPGDQLLAIEGFRPDRRSAWRLHYAFETIAPRAGMRLVAAAPNGEPRELLVKANVRKLPQLIDAGFERPDPDEIRMQRSQVLELGDRLMIWKLPSFDVSNPEIDQYLAEASQHQALILDLRGTSGASESTLTRLLGGLMAHDVRIGYIAGRKETKPFIAKAWHSDKAFSGKIVVLIDSASAAYSEIFARVMQIENRGTVIGERSSGRVMQAAVFHRQAGFTSSIIPFAVRVSVGNMIMADGRSLEHVGVTPDERVIPNAEDLAAGRDPVLSQAAHLLGVDLTPEKAGSLFPVVWRSFK